MLSTHIPANASLSVYRQQNGIMYTKIRARWYPLHESAWRHATGKPVTSNVDRSRTSSSHLISSPGHQCALHVDTHDVRSCRTRRYEPDLLASNAVDAVWLGQVRVRFLPRCLILHSATVTLPSNRWHGTSWLKLSCWHTSSSLSVFFFVRSVACLPTCSCLDLSLRAKWTAVVRIDILGAIARTAKKSVPPANKSSPPCHSVPWSAMDGADNNQTCRG